MNNDKPWMNSNQQQSRPKQGAPQGSGRPMRPPMREQPSMRPPKSQKQIELEKKKRKQKMKKLPSKKKKKLFYILLVLVVLMASLAAVTAIYFVMNYL